MKKMRLIDLDELLKREEQAYRQVITQEAKTPDAPIVMTLIHEAFVGMLADSPIVEAEPVRHGRWIDKHGNGDLYCSECGAVMEKHEHINHNLYYCYHCGAKMDKEE